MSATTMTTSPTSRTTHGPMSPTARFLVRALRREERRKRQDEGTSHAAQPEDHSDVAVQSQPKHPLPVIPLTIVLLLADAVERSGLGLGGMRDLLAQPAPIVGILSPLSGFNTALRSLMSESDIPGLALDLAAPGSHKFSYRSQFGRRDEADGSSPRRSATLLRLTTDFSAAQNLRELADALAEGTPMLSLGQTRDDLPLRFADVANIILHTGPLTPAIVEDVIRLVVGNDADGEARGSEVADVQIAGGDGEASAIADSDDPDRLHLDAVTCQHLTLADLAIAIRPGRSHEAIIADLVRYARDNKQRKANEDKDDRGDGAGSTGGSGKGGWSSGSGRKSSGNNKNGRGRDNGRAGMLVAPDTSTEAPHLERLAGYGAAHDWAMALKGDLAAWRDGSLGWDQLSSRILLSGPPGTGKTLFARALANTLELPLLVTSVASWLQASYLGDVLQRMERAFAQASASQPAILFIDEIDNLGSREDQDRREHGDYWISLVNQALTLLDGAARTEGVIVVGATNRPHVIDPAILRSGRLEKQVRITLPDQSAREGILRIHLGEALGEVAASRSTDAEEAIPNTLASLAALARLARGFSSADIERLVREAKGRARREERALAYADLEAPMLDQRPKLSAAKRRRIAIHEAGHAVIHMVRNLGTPQRITMEGPFGPHTLSSDLDNEMEGQFSDLQRLLVFTLAGRAAESYLLGSLSIGSGGGEASCDLALATRIATRLEGSYGWGKDKHPLIWQSDKALDERLAYDPAFAARVHVHLDEAYLEAYGLCIDHRHAIERLAQALEAEGELEGEAIRKAARLWHDPRPEPSHWREELAARREARARALEGDQAEEEAGEQTVDAGGSASPGAM